MPKGFMGGGSFQPQQGPSGAASFNASSQPVFMSDRMNTEGPGFFDNMSWSRMSERDSTPASMHNIFESMFGNESRRMDTDETEINLTPNTPISLLEADATTSGKSVYLYPADTIGRRKTIIISKATNLATDAIDIIPIVKDQLHTTITLTGIGASVELIYAAHNEWVVVSKNDSCSVYYDPDEIRIQPPPQPGD